MFARRDGYEIYYRVDGSGPPLIVLHGGMGLDHAYLRPSLQPLTSSHQLCFLDFLGNGRSSPPANWTEVTHDTWIADIEAVREANGWSEVALFGHSYGGVLALEYALRHPHRVNALVLCSAAAAFDHVPAALERRAQREPELVARVLAELSGQCTSDAELRRKWSVVLLMYLSRRTPKNLALLDHCIMRAAAMNRANGELLPAFDVRGHLPHIEVPTLVLAGEDDALMPPDLAAEPLRAISCSEVRVLGQAGHFAFAENPEAFLAAIRGWAPLTATSRGRRQ